MPVISIEQIINSIGKTIEIMITGQTDYQVTLSEFRTANCIDNGVQAKMVLPQVTKYIEDNFGFAIKNPVIIHLAKPTAQSWKKKIVSGHKHIGNYTAQSLGENNAHIITIVPNLERNKFKAVLAHELVHAYQAEQKILRTNKGIKEGMARWVEYYVLLHTGQIAEARKLTNYRCFIFGRSLLDILKYEKLHGRCETTQWLHKLP